MNGLDTTAGALVVHPSSIGSVAATPQSGVTDLQQPSEPRQKPGATGEVCIQSGATQIKPTFSRLDLGAGELLHPSGGPAMQD